MKMEQIEKIAKEINQSTSGQVNASVLENGELTIEGFSVDPREADVYSLTGEAPEDFQKLWKHLQTYNGYADNTDGVFPVELSEASKETLVALAHHLDTVELINYHANRGTLNYEFSDDASLFIDTNGATRYEELSFPDGRHFIHDGTEDENEETFDEEGLIDRYEELAINQLEEVIENHLLKEHPEINDEFGGLADHVVTQYEKHEDGGHYLVLGNYKGYHVGGQETDIAPTQNKGKSR